MDLTVNLAPSYRDLKDPTTRQNFDDTVEQKRVIDLRACHKLKCDQSKPIRRKINPKEKESAQSDFPSKRKVLNTIFAKPPPTKHPS